MSNGDRVMAAWLVNVEVEAENHLSSGPCISIEYRNRGFGSLLLKESLLLAAKAGCPLIHGVTRATGPAAKFVYPKYEGKSRPYVVDLGHRTACLSSSRYTLSNTTQSILESPTTTLLSLPY